MSLEEESASETLGNLQGKGDKFTKLSLIERKRLADLEDAISYITSETEKYRSLAKKSAIEVMNIHVLTPNPAYSRADGVNIGKEAAMVTAKTLIILEAKVNKLLQRKSEIQNNNKKMKETINHFRLLRLQTDSSHSKFEATLAETKERIETLLAESTKVVEEREQLIEKKEALERLNQEEQAKFTEEYEGMGAFIKQQNAALEESLLKERKADRNGTALVKATPGAEGTGTDFEGVNMTSDMTLEQEVEMAKTVGNLNAFMAAEQTSLSELRDKIASNEAMFEKLKSMTGVESLEEMVSNYIAHEEEMFSLYNFIQAMNTEIDQVIEGTAQLESDIAQFKSDQQDQDQQRRTTIDELQQRLASTLEVTKSLEEQNMMQQESVSQISKKVGTLFFKLSCDQMDTKGSQANAKNQRFATSRPESKAALITGQGVTDSNVLDYLGCIEQRAVDIISEYLHIVHSREATANGIAARLTMSATGGPRSPTPGPSSPMVWHGHKHHVELDAISDDDMLMDGGDNNNNNSSAGNANNNNKAAKEDIEDSKPVDLSTYKSKLQRKLGLSMTLGGSQGGSRAATREREGGSGTLNNTSGGGMGKSASTSAIGRK